MYRQILVCPEDRKLQHIFWRADPSQPIVEYQLNTVTYGINTSVYQAIRTIQQLRQDKGPCFPLAAASLVNSIYVDDFVDSANSIEEARLLRTQLIGLFERGGFEISKWSSNATELLSHPDDPQRPYSIPQDDSLFVKILGLVWCPTDDYFSFSVKEPVRSATKRVILSHIARTFDPLGFLSPIIFHVKTLLQEMWRQGPRYVFTAHSRSQLIGFSDATSRGYAAAVYIRVLTPKGSLTLSY
ncbi:uncharacterized protein [Halyomorpha halys]|uniref:uncharacterized protein n=1 Tax=Halyomorpha halys TaxID=286706 RepID=UPI0034D2B5C8